LFDKKNLKLKLILLLPFRWSKLFNGGDWNSIINCVCAVNHSTNHTSNLCKYSTFIYLLCEI